MNRAAFLIRKYPIGLKALLKINKSSQNSASLLPRLNLAEGLSALVISQLKNEGAPMIMPGVIMNMDMKTSVTAYGSPESSLMACAIAEVYHWLGLKISDYQHNMAPAPSRGLPHTPSSAGGR